MKLPLQPPPKREQDQTKSSLTMPRRRRSRGGNIRGWMNPRLRGTNDLGQVLYGPATYYDSLRCMNSRTIAWERDPTTNELNGYHVPYQPPLMCDVTGQSCAACTNPACYCVYKRYHLLKRFTRPLCCKCAYCQHNPLLPVPWSLDFEFEHDGHTAGYPDNEWERYVWQTRSGHRYYPALPGTPKTPFP